jgi:hypothetical protein
LIADTPVPIWRSVMFWMVATVGAVVGLAGAVVAAGAGAVVAGTAGLGASVGFGGAAVGVAAGAAHAAPSVTIIDTAPMRRKPRRERSAASWIDMVVDSNPSYS